ncbi:MAG: hypothetical protein HC892_14635 [Saprospiraceae bacterium]|nr:hypothetical protein [Saprospiraceae bacterium]
MNNHLTQEDYAIILKHLHHKLHDSNMGDKRKVIQEYINKLEGGTTIDQFGNSRLVASLQSLLSRTCMSYENHRCLLRGLMLHPEQLEARHGTLESIYSEYMDTVEILLELRRVVKKIRV